MKRWVPLLVCAAGLAALLPLLRLFDAPLPVAVRVTRDEARVIADRAARQNGIDLERAWPVSTWESSPLLEREFAGQPDRRRAAAADPVVAPRLSSYQVVYFHQGREKFPQYGDVWVSAQTGEVLGARRRALNEERGANAPEQQLRTVADRFISSRSWPGGAVPQFESARPTVYRNRTDWMFRYRVHSGFSTGNVAFYVVVFFIGDQLAGWMPLEEYADGSNFRTEGSEIAGAFAQFGVMFAVLLFVLILFLKKYHAGEVGVQTAFFLFGTVILYSLLIDFFIGPASSVGTGLGSGLDGQQTAVAYMGFKFLFYDLPLAVVVFLAWAVGESYARERWGERLASYDAFLRRDPVNATVGRSLLVGLLSAPAVAAATLASAAIPIVAGLAHPTGGRPFQIIGISGPIGVIPMAALEATLVAVVCVLFFSAFFARKRMLWLGVLAGAGVGSLWLVLDTPIAPPTWQYLFGFGGVLAAAAVFLAWDLLASGTAIFFGSLLLGFAPVLRFTEGNAFKLHLTTFIVPVAIVLVWAIAALLTRREVIYSYEDVAPHVRRIIERERVKAEIDAANRIQAALLPQSAPVVNGATVASHYRAATEIGGDYFDFLPVGEDGEVGIAFGDVSGHGLTSGIVMSMAKSALLVQVGYDASPRTVLEVLNDIVMKTAPKRMLMTFFFGVLDPRSHRLRFASAGHLDPYVFRAASRRLEALSSWGFPLGVRRREPFVEHAVSFDAGDRLILYSDGLIEALDDDGEPFGFDRFERALVENGHLSADDIKKALLASIRRFTRNRPPEDDQTLVVVSFDEPAAMYAPQRTAAAVGYGAVN